MSDFGDFPECRSVFLLHTCHLLNLSKIKQKTLLGCGKENTQRFEERSSQGNGGNTADLQLRRLLDLKQQLCNLFEVYIQHLAFCKEHFATQSRSEFAK